MSIWMDEWNLEHSHSSRVRLRAERSAFVTMQKNALLRGSARNICVFCEHRRIVISEQRRPITSSTTPNNGASHNVDMAKWQLKCRSRQLQRTRAQSAMMQHQARCFGGFALSSEERKSPLATRQQPAIHPALTKTRNTNQEDLNARSDQQQTSYTGRPYRELPRFRVQPNNTHHAPRIQSRAPMPIIREERGRLLSLDEPVKEPVPVNWQGLRKKPSPEDISKLLESAESRPPVLRRVIQKQPIRDVMRNAERFRPSYTPFLPQRIRDLGRRDPEQRGSVLGSATSVEDHSLVKEPPSGSMEGSVGLTPKKSNSEFVTFSPFSTSGAATTTHRSKEDGRIVEENEPTGAVESYRQRRERRRLEAAGAFMEGDTWARDSRNTRRKGRRTQIEHEQEAEDEARALREERRRSRQEKKMTKKEAPKPISLPEYISVVNLATALRVHVDRLVTKMEELGFEDVQNYHILTSEDASLIAMEYNFQPLVEDEFARDLQALPEPEDKAHLPARPPIVTIMGHVDHGKTTLLDYLRKSAVVKSEFGGITQHIGAFSVPLPSGKTITFLDTPGHAAFLDMRQRGANVTDIVVLVVAADDSVKPQTIEAINHAQGAGVPMIVAINKMDKQGAAPEVVKRDLMANGVEVEDFGGDVQAIHVSGKTGQGMEDLEEAIVTLSEMLDHRADPQRQVEGWVIEAATKTSGKVATVLVRQGTLRIGDVLVAGQTWARVRSLKTDAGIVVESAGPGTPVEVGGWREQPEAGDEVIQASDEHKATSVVDYRIEKAERIKLAVDMEAINEARRAEAAKKATDEEATRRAEEYPDGEPEDAKTEEISTGPTNVPFIIKADVSGSAEAILNSVSAIGNGEVQAQVLRTGVGAVSEFDIEHAATAGGSIINFNTQTPGHIAALADANKVRILNHNIIYRLVDDVKSIVSEKLAPKVTQRVTGEAEILQTFNFNIRGRKFILIAGSRVRTGTLKKDGKVRVLRNQEIIYDGTISSLKSHKKDVQEISKGTECGVSFENFEDFFVGDVIQHYEEKSEKRLL
ncbi:initiation factor 2 [Pseudovirgaria hyperparasitica]|uniref:Translation initiation factor IF-2, mitochondrial n=1 Tax=Pseudovirgaria hyperparasitica TaxID=470096 RepID=A0A6A6WG13_9PEZI|nr:initiation factor 2 [Pseudovirgaria hyperparasitica]KAF2760876.1 initiation factor 2 [Pseudovirgaria hyperparasitica]